MHPILSLEIILLSIFFSVQATIFVTQPAARSACHGGLSCTVEWLDDGEAPLLNDIGPCYVGLYNGNAVLVQQIEPVDVSSVHVLEFTPDSRAGPDSDAYYINFTTVNPIGNPPAHYSQYSPSFSLGSMTGSFASPIASDTATIQVPSTVLNAPPSSITSTTTIGSASLTSSSVPLPSASGSDSSGGSQTSTASSTSASGITTLRTSSSSAIGSASSTPTSSPSSATSAALPSRGASFALIAALRRRRRTDWKRRQNGQTFLDHTVVHIRAGTGGDGCVAFHREKFVPYGPPSGGNGGRGGDVYILPTPHLTTLSSVPTRIRGQNGGNGQGTWQNGETRRRSSSRSRSARSCESSRRTTLAAARTSTRRRWSHSRAWTQRSDARSCASDGGADVLWPGARASHSKAPARAAARFLDLDKPEEMEGAEDPNAPLGHRRPDTLGHMIAAGGAGGMGNPHFLSPTNRSPKWATRGAEGERVSLSLELKLLADVGLTEVAGYAFTTLNPVVAVVRVADDGTYEGWAEGLVHGDTRIEEQREQEIMESGGFADAPTRNEKLVGQDDVQVENPYASMEAFRFTVADNPGLIEHASSNVGLGHSFLRSIERSHALAYVVDLSADAPWDDLRVLRDELEKYKPGLSPKARLVLANKADLLGGSDTQGHEELESVEKARAKLRKLEEFVEQEMTVQLRDENGDLTGEQKLDVVPISAKYSLNLRKVVGLMRTYIEEKRGGLKVLPSSSVRAKAINA
ncbi:putative GTP-binding protein P8A3.11c, mitochondrial [Grifola frondosa]|uniref:Putative GTP-binding protein P8A3.11c, mitochondrial n=1 Tax=Grifola frondosa TaxID=5627 RepID=A0A1C7MJ34_GRIFR|nr:putative GTP-binding protein P8A3.11c, mitochondrial [Grifola frondosa]